MRKLKEIIENKELELTAHDFIQFFDEEKFNKYMDDEKATWKDLANAELFTVEYKDLVKSKFYKEIRDLPVTWAYRKTSQDARGVAIILHQDKKLSNEFKEKAEKALLSSGNTIKRKELANA